MKTNKRTQSKPIETTAAENIPLENSARQLGATGFTAADEFPIYQPAPEEIADRAYAHFEADGSQHGNDIEHWLAAEADVLEEYKS